MGHSEFTRRYAMGLGLGALSGSALFARDGASAATLPTGDAACRLQDTDRFYALDLEQGLRRLRGALRLPIGSDARNDSLRITGSGWSHDRLAISSGFDGSGLDEAVLVFDRASTNDATNNAQIMFSEFAVIGGNSRPTRWRDQHGFYGAVNQLDARNLLVQYLAGHGWFLENSFSNRITNGLIFGNYGNGIYLRDTANNVLLSGIRAFANGMSWNREQGNIVFDCRRSTAFGSTVSGCDVSYSGHTAFSFANGILRSVRVQGGRCVVTLSEPHGLPSGARLSAQGSPALRQAEAIEAQTIDATRFAFATRAPDGNYDRADFPALAFSTYSHGLLMVGTSGCRIEDFYAEDCRGPAGRITQSEAVTVSGGFVLNSDLIVEESTGVEIGGIKFQGDASLVTRETTDRAEINVLSSNVFSDGARWVRGPSFMRDGIRYVGSRPRTGNWQVGEFALRWNAAPSDPFAYRLTSTGWVDVPQGEAIAMAAGRAG